MPWGDGDGTVDGDGVWACTGNEASTAAIAISVMHPVARMPDSFFFPNDGAG